MTPRYLLQRIGTEVGRDGDLAALSGLGISAEVMAEALAFYRVKPGLNAWIDALFSFPFSRPIALADVRFPNEAEAVRARGGWVIRVERPGFDTGSFNAHASEVEVDRCQVDETFLNEGSLEDLHRLVDRRFSV